MERVKKVYRVHINPEPVDYDTKAEAFRQAKNLARASGHNIRVTEEEIPVPKVAGNAFAAVPPKQDASGKTVNQFLRETFEFEYCAECRQDAKNHTVVIGPTGSWFALCRTQVIFRKWRKNDESIIALFPCEPATGNPYECDSFEHIGQHGAASLDVIYRTKPAKPEEYAALKRELESAPYNYHLDVRQRVTSDALEIRRRKLAR
jgi:hypothetical protein